MAGKGKLKEIHNARIAVAGSGPAGLMAGIYAAREGAKVIVFEQKQKAASKLYATGNGRCNFTNLCMTQGVYRGGGSALAMEAVDTFDRNDLLYFFQDLGLMTKHIGDYIYPYNEQASSVAAVLLAECRRLGVEIHTVERVVDIKCYEDGKISTYGKGDIQSAVDIKYYNAKPSSYENGDDSKIEVDINDSTHNDGSMELHKGSGDTVDIKSDNVIEKPYENKSIPIGSVDIKHSSDDEVHKNPDNSNRIVDINTSKDTKNIGNDYSKEHRQVNITTVTSDDKKHIYTFDAVIIAPGGKASPAHGSDGNMNKIIRRLGHTIIPQEPALVPLTFSDRKLSSLAGVRIKCAVSVVIGSDDQTDKTYTEQGEIIFNKDNISGIPVMQLSRYAVCEMVKGNNALISLDLFPEYTGQEVYDHIKKAFRAWGDEKRSASEALGLCINQKIADHILGEDKEKKAAGFSEDRINKIAEGLKAFEIKISGNAGFSRAQVTAGGVDTKEIDPDTFGSLICPGVYFAGEILDVDGTCGGYNLHFAFASGRIAGQAAAIMPLQ